MIDKTETKVNRSRINRIIIGTLGPCLFGSLSIAIIAHSRETAITGAMSKSEFLDLWLFSFAMSIPLMGIQSTVYALLMGFVVSKKSDNIHVFLGTSGLLGFIAGMTLVFFGSKTYDLLLIRLLTGLIIGGKLYFMHETKGHPEATSITEPRPELYLGLKGF